MRALGKTSTLSRVVPKNHFCVNSIFREEPLINWTFTDAVLFTAYDVYKSESNWMNSVINSGGTLKEGLIELGFPKEVRLLADTGVFEMEARKAGLSRELGIEIDIELSVSEILEAYDLSGADVFVSPDEIVLPSDSQEEVAQKIDRIKQNMSEVLDIINPGKVMGVVQGIEKPVIDDLLDHYRSLGVRTFALGGAIPLYHHSKSLLERTVRHVRDATKKRWLHIFGLPRSGLINYYLHEMMADSVDTSLLLYLAARRRYLVDSRAIPVREARLRECECEGCRSLEQLKNSPRSAGFFINLYIHNLTTAVRMSLNSQPAKEEPHSPAKARRVDHQVYPAVWETAEDLLSRRRSGLGEEEGDEIEG